jgi:anaerobic selenocysteine-containing dehydrogenase
MATENARHTTCPFCEALCGLRITTEGERVVSIRGNPDDPLSRGHICPKATALQDVHEDPDRLRGPVRRVGDGWEEICWIEALDLAAAGIAAVQRAHGRHSVAMYLGNPVAHKYSALIGGLLLGDVLHTKNRYSASSVDQAPHMFAAWQMFGHPLAMPVPDIERVMHLVVLGANPIVSNGSIMTAPDMKRRLKELRERGGRLVVIDPRRTETAEVADAFHFVRPGSDALLLLAWVHVLFDEGLAQTDGVNGADALAEVARPWTPERVAEATGIAPDALRTLVREHAAADGAVLYGRLGVSTTEFGGLASWLVYAVSALTGNLDRPGGLMWAAPAADLVELTRFGGPSGSWGRWRTRTSDLPELNGELPAAAMADEMTGEGRVRALITVAGNPVLSTPNGRKLAEALDGLDFQVAIDPWITATSSHADLILPPVSHLETDHFGLAFHGLAVRNTVKYCAPVFPRPEGALDDWEILTGLASRLAATSDHKAARKDRLTVGAARALGARGVLDLALRTGRHGVLRRPFGRRLTLKKLERLDSGMDLGPLEPAGAARITTPSGRVEVAPRLCLDDLPRLEAAFEEGRFTGGLRLIGRRQLRGCNSWLHNSERMQRGKQRRCTLMMHPDDAAERGLKDGQTVTVTSRVGQVTTQLEVADVMPGVVSMPHGWGHAGTGARLAVAEKAGGASVNDLTDDALVDRLTGNAALSGVRVEVR